MRRPLAVVFALVAAPASAAEPVEFRRDVIAALSRAGCNQGACHGSPQGKNGFRLSLRGADPDLDLVTLTRETGGRRVSPQNPDDSLILLKGSGRVPHQGGRLFGPSDPAYRVIAAWVAAGCPDSAPAGLVRLEIQPGGFEKSDPPARQLAAFVHFRDGTRRDVTALTVFTSSDPAAVPVSPAGRVTFPRTAEASVLARYLDQIAGVRLVRVEPDPAFAFRGPPPANAIDELVFAKQRELQLLPAAVCSDEVFLRRVYLDVTGTIPTPEAAAAFLDSRGPDKRAKLIDRLLASDDYALFWAMKWADVLRGSPTTISDRGVHSFHRYLVRTVADDRPVTEFARDLLTASGNTLHRPAANFFRVSRTPEEAAEAAAQLFLGVRVQCAKCHNHPFENITQADYYGLAAYFARVQLKGAQFGLDDEVVALAPGRELNNPLTRRPRPRVAFGDRAPALGPDDDRRKALADWLSAPANRYRRRWSTGCGTTCSGRGSWTRWTTSATRTRRATRSCSSSWPTTSPAAATG